MPFAGFQCELSGEAISTDSCLACARSGARTVRSALRPSFVNIPQTPEEEMQVDFGSVSQLFGLD